MAAMGNAAINAALALIFNGTTWTGIGQNAGSPLTNLFFGLASSAPSPSSDQTSNEISYTSYARVSVARSSSGFLIASQTVTPVADIIFPTATGGSATATYFTVGTTSSGASQLIAFGPLQFSLAITTGLTPILSDLTNITLN